MFGNSLHYRNRNRFQKIDALNDVNEEKQIGKKMKKSDNTLQCRILLTFLWSVLP